MAYYRTLLLSCGPAVLYLLSFLSHYLSAVSYLVILYFKESKKL